MGKLTLKQQLRGMVRQGDAYHTLHIPPALWRRAAVFAQDAGVTLNGYVVQAVLDRVVCDQEEARMGCVAPDPRGPIADRAESASLRPLDWVIDWSREIALLASGRSRGPRLPGSPNR